MSEVIVVGAGASGLFAARELSKEGFNVTILEARNRIGGRIHSVSDPDFDSILELGAEFIHGDLELTKSLLKEYGISYHPMKGEMWRFENGKLHETEDMVDDGHYKVLAKQLKQLKEDLPLSSFLKLYFPGQEYSSLRNSVTRFVEGYDAADIHKASTFAFREEWLNAGSENQYRVKGGYQNLLEQLLQDCLKYKARIILNSEVKTIIWQEKMVEVSTAGESFQAEKVIITLPLRLLKNGDIKFNPPLNEKREAIEKLEMGGVIKFLLQFDSPFWNDKELQASLSIERGKPMFIFSESQIGTWWTQHPESSSLLTGYLAGPRADELKNKDDEELFLLAMESLQQIFSGKAPAPKAWRIANWISDPYAGGGYSYSVVDDKRYRENLLQPIKETLFFAGEGTSSGKSGGTVEAAFTSAKECSETIIKLTKKVGRN